MSEYTEVKQLHFIFVIVSFIVGGALFYGTLSSGLNKLEQRAINELSVDPEIYIDVSMDDLPVCIGAIFMGFVGFVGTLYASCYLCELNDKSKLPSCISNRRSQDET